MVGSFLNVAIHRMPRMMEHDEANHICRTATKAAAPPDRYDLMVPRSACPHCGHQIAAWENVPAMSYLFLRGKLLGTADADQCVAIRWWNWPRRC